MAGPRGRVIEKPKDMKAAIAKLIAYCKKEMWVIVLALVMAIVSAVLTIIGPNKISEITNYIYDGLTGGVSVEEIGADIQKQMMTGELTPQEILSWLPEGTDPSTVDFQNIDFNNQDDPVVRAILDNLTLSDEYIAAHQGGGINLQGIVSVCILLAIIFVVSALCMFGQHYIMANVTQKITKRMRGDLEHKINSLPLKYFSRNSYGDVLSRMTNDVDMIGQGLSNSTAQIVTAAAQFVGCLIMMFITNPVLAGTTIITTLLGLIGMLIIMKHSQKYFKARQKDLGQLNGYIEEMYSGHDVIRISNAEKSVKAKFLNLSHKVRNDELKSQFIASLMQPLMNFVGNLGYVAVCVVGAIMVINGHISFGVITAFLIYVRLFEQPLRQLSMSMTNMQSAAAASERVFDFLEEEELSDETQKTDSLENVRGEVEFRNVRFAYPSAPEREIIHGFTAHVRPGQKVAIVGPTGAGKTTLVNLLMRFFEPTHGEILIDGVNTDDLKRDAVHNLFGMVLQDTWLFEGTVRENLVFNCENVSDETVENAAKACGIDRFIKALPQGYDTIMDENTSISAGQKQLFTIARAMIQNSPMLILDEATSSVDTRTEIITQQAMDQLTQKRTSFVIAHRLSTIKNADLILVMNNGDIIEQGNHEELLEKGGFYADLYNSQFEKTA